jgi:cell division protein FtsA
MPTGVSLDAQAHILDPSGMMGEKLGVDLHVVTAEAAAARNLMLAVERCHLGVEAVIATPYAAGLSSSPTTRPRWAASWSIWAAARPASACSPRAISFTSMGRWSAATTSPWTSRADSRRAWPMRSAQDAVRLGDRRRDSDERDIVAVPQVDEDERDVPNHLPKSHLVRIIKPRVEEILELVRDRPEERRLRGARRAARWSSPAAPASSSDFPNSPAAFFRARSGSAGRSGSKDCRRPRRDPPSRPRSGSWVYPQVAHIEHFEPRAGGLFAGTGTDGGYLSKVGRWIRESFWTSRSAVGQPPELVNGAGRAQATKEATRGPKIMAISLQAPDIRELKPRITVFGSAARAATPSTT